MAEMSDLKVNDDTGSGGLESMTSAMMETMLSPKAMFSVKHLLDMHDHLQQDQQVDGADVSPATTHDDPLMLVGTTAGACLVAGGEMSLMVAAAGSPSRHAGYADMPDLVQASAITAGCYDQDVLYNRWMQSNASLDCFAGLSLLMK